MSFFEGVACVFPFSWNLLKDSLRKTKIHHAIWLQEMQMLQNKGVFFFFFPSLGFSELQLRSTQQTCKDQRGKEKRTYMCERQTQACTSTATCLQKLTWQMPPQVTWCWRGLWPLNRIYSWWDVLASDKSMNLNLLFNLTEPAEPMGG